MRLGGIRFEGPKNKDKAHVRRRKIKRSERGGENVPTLGIRKENAGESRAKLNRVYCRAMSVANRREKRMTRDRGEEQQDSVTDLKIT